MRHLKANHMMNRRNLIQGLFGACVAVGGLGASALGAVATSISRFSLTEGRALKGFDTTAYFTQEVARDGADLFVVQWKGAAWRFADAQSAALFSATPDDFAPQFGGYCTRAMSIQKEVPGDPEVWRLHGGKLYVFFAARGGRLFDDAPEEMIAKAQAHWDSLSFEG